MYKYKSINKYKKREKNKQKGIKEEKLKSKKVYKKCQKGLKRAWNSLELAEIDRNGLEWAGLG